MKNTRLYFDKQFTPIVQSDLCINFLGEFSPNIHNSTFPILSSIQNDDPSYGVPSTEYSIYSVSMQQLLDAPYIFKLSHYTSGPNIGGAVKESDDYGDYLFFGISCPFADRSMFNEGVDSGDITCTFQITNITAADSEGSPVTLDNYNFIKANTRFTTDTPTTTTETPLSIRFYINDPAIHYPQGFKWVKFTVTANIGYKIKEGSKYTKYFSIPPESALGEKQYVFYAINPNYTVPGVFIEVYDDYSGQYNSTTLDYITTVNYANLTKQDDGTWILEYSYNVGNGVDILNTIPNIPDASVTEGSTIYTDTTMTPPVPFIIILRT